MPRFSSSHQPHPEARYRVPSKPTRPKRTLSADQLEAAEQAAREARAAADLDWIPPRVVVGSPPAPAVHTASTQEIHVPETTHEPVPFTLTPEAHDALAEGQPTSAEIRARMAALDQDLKAAVKAEQITKQEQAAHAHSQSQKITEQALLPTLTALRRHLANLQGVQNGYDQTLRDMARSCAGDQDGDVRRKVTAIHGLAGPLRERIALAVKATQSAIKGISYASTYANDRITLGATEGAERALTIKPADLAAEAQSLVDQRLKLRGGVTFSPRVQSGRVDPSDFQPTRADFGPSII